MGGRSGLIGTVGGDSTATSNGPEGSGLGNRVEMLEMYEAGRDQANTIVTPPPSLLNLPKLAREYRFSRPIELPLPITNGNRSYRAPSGAER